MDPEEFHTRRERIVVSGPKEELFLGWDPEREATIPQICHRDPRKSMARIGSRGLTTPKHPKPRNDGFPGSLFGGIAVALTTLGLLVWLDALFRVVFFSCVVYGSKNNKIVEDRGLSKTD